MQKVSCLTDVNNLAVKELLKLRFDQLEGVIDDTEFFVVETIDTVDALEVATGCPIVTSWFSSSVFGDEDFIPSFDFIEEHKNCYEMMFNTTDDATVVILIPKAISVDARLLALCQQYA
jgi:hypothetical protein